MRELFSDDNGILSMLRVMSFISLLVAITSTFLGYSPEVLIMWLTAAFAPKTIQKFAERIKTKNV